MSLLLFTVLQAAMFNLNSVDRVVQNDTIKIVLSEDIAVTWDSNDYFIVEDKLWITLQKDFPDRSAVLLDLISNTDQTQAETCGVDRNLMKGDMAFLILLKYYGGDFPLAKILDSQCDYFSEDCPYPVGFFTVLDKGRINIQKRTKAFLK